MKKKTDLPAESVFFPREFWLNEIYGTIAAPTGMSPFEPHGNEKNELFELRSTK